MNTVIRVALYYFVLVFSAGFVFGSIRVLVLVDLFGEHNAELFEMPLMAIVCAFAAGFLVLRNLEDLNTLGCILIGLVALGILLFAELGVVHLIRQMTLSDYLRSRVSLAGLAYLVGLVWYAAAPSVFYLLRKTRGAQ